VITVEFLVLGSVDVRTDGRALALGGPKQRALLALLLLNANGVVSRDRLIDALWGERAPATAQRSLDSYLSRLRTLLGPDRIERQPPGYLLHVAPGELDLARFEGLLAQGRAAAAAGDATTARALLGEGLGLWRGRALADLESEPLLCVEAERLEERRLLACETRIDVELELGAGSELVSELEQLVSAHPFRERLLGQLMLSLYRAGRQADALAAYRECRRRFAEELGLEPSVELRALEQRILGQDTELGARSVSTRRIARRRRRPRARAIAAALALAAVAAGAAIGIELGTGGSSASTARGSTTGVFELTGNSSVVAGAAQADAPTAMAADPTSIWLAEPNAGALVRVDRVTRRVINTVPVGGRPSAVAYGDGSVWFASVPGHTVGRIDPATYRLTDTIHLGNGQVAALAFGLGRLWVADAADEELLSYDPRTAHRQSIPLNVQPSALGVGAGGVWVADYDDGLLAEVDPRSGAGLGTVHVGGGPVAVAVGHGAVWVANSLDNTVTRVDPHSDTPGAAIAVGNAPVALAIDRTSVLTANEYSSSISRIDPRDDAVHTTSIGGGPTALASAGGRIWVGTRALGAHRGGTLVLLHIRPLSLDTGGQEDLPPWQSDGLTNDALLAKTRVGLHVVPDLAVAVPTPADGGLTYTFKIRKEPYSNGRLVRPEDFRRAIERLFRINAGWSGAYSRIVGTNQCDRARCDLSRGILVDDAARTITFRLSEPDPNFLSGMTLMSAAPVPPGTPLHDVGFTPIPGTGPYEVASANAHEIRYVRNPHFQEWSHAAQPDGYPDVIVMRFGLSVAQEVREVESGKADWTADSVPGNLLGEVTTRFPAQWHPLPTTVTDLVRLNTTVAPFNDIRVRKALNLAIDRAAVARLDGGPLSATPTCQTLPPDVRGYVRYCPYTGGSGGDGHWRSPNLALARGLVAASGTRGERITVFGHAGGGASATSVARYVARVLRELGYRAEARLVPDSYYRKASAHTWHVMQMVTLSEQDSYPGSFFSYLSCGREDQGWFCDLRLDDKVIRAGTLDTTDRRAANLLWTKVDHEIVDRALALPLVNQHTGDFVSKRVRGYDADPLLGLIVDQVSLR
jgi:DNA-binding SARP family transcriptional activator/ABC-type transport system substrate-binding protein